jgi:hypothetical protein
MRKHALVLGLAFLACVAYAGNNLVENPNQAIWKFSQDMDVPHVAWAKPLAGKPVRATIIAPRVAYRDAVELCQRLSVEVNRVMTSSFAEAASSSHFDQYPNQGAKPEEWLDLIREELRKETDLFIIGKFRWTAFPADIRQTILEKVQAGAGLLYVNPEFEKTTDGTVGVFLATGDPPKPPAGQPAAPEGLRVPLKAVDASHPAIRNLVGLRLPQLESKEWTDIVYAGQLGKGRFLAVDYSFRFEHGNATNEACRQMAYEGGAWGLVKHSLVSVARDPEMPCAYEYLMSFLAKATLWAAGREPAERIERFQVEEGLKGIRVSCAGAKPTDSVSLEIRNADGLLGARVRQWDRVTGAVDPSPLGCGTYFVNAWLKDASGAVLDWGTVRLDTPAEAKARALEEIRLEVAAPAPGAPLVGGIRLEGNWRADDRLRLSATDNFGRCLWQRELRPTAPAVPFRAEFHPGRSIAAVFAAERLHDEKTAERIEKMLCFSRRELDGDFSFIVWSDFTYDDRVMRQDMETCRRLGVDATLHVGPPLRDACVRSNVRLAHYVLRVTGYQVRGFSHPNSLETWRNLFRRVGREMAPFAPLTMTFGDETCFGWPDDGTCVTSYLTQPYSDQTFRLFLGWYFDKSWGHFNLAQVNKAWGTSFKTEDEVKVLGLDELRKNNARGQWVCEATWADWQFQRLLRESAETGRAEVPYAYFGDEGVGNMYSGEGHDYYLLQKDMDICQLYDYMAGPFFVQSFPKRDSLRGMWTGNYGYYNGEVDDEWMRSFAWRSLFYNMNSVWWWMTSLSIRCDGRPIACFEGLAEETQRIKRGPATLLLQAARPHPPQVGVLYSPNTVHVHTFDQGKAGPHRYALAVACQGLIRAGYPFRVLHPTQLDDGVLSAGYRVLVLPAVLALSEAQVKTILEFVEKGGLLIADRAPDQYFTEFGLPYKQDPFRSVFKPGATPEELTHGQGKAVLLKEPFGLSPLERYKNVFGESYSEKRQQTLAEMFRGFIEGGIGLKPPVGLVLPDGKRLSDAEISVFADGMALYVGIDRNGRYWEGEQLKWLRWDDYQEEVGASLELPAPRHVYDVTAGAYLGHGKTVRLELTSYPRLLAVLPSKMGDLRLEGLSKSYAQGSTVRGQVSVKRSPDADFASVVHLVMKTEAGERLPWSERNLVAPGGVASFELPLALDEAPGKYEMEARDVVSGLAASHPFRITRTEK